MERRLENKHQSNDIPLNKSCVIGEEDDLSTTMSWREPSNHELWGGSIVERSSSSPCCLLSSSLSLLKRERERERGSAPSLRERRHIGWCFSSHSWAFLYSYVHYTCSHLTPLCWDTRIPIACLIIYSSRVFKVTWDLLVWATSDCLNSNTLHSSWLGGSCHYILFSKLQDCYIHLQFHVDVYALSIFIWQTYKTSTMHYQIYNTKWLVLFQKKKNHLTLTVALFSLTLITDMVRSTSKTTILVRNENKMLFIAVVFWGTTTMLNLILLHPIWVKRCHVPWGPPCVVLKHRLWCLKNHNMWTPSPWPCYPHAYEGKWQVELSNVKTTSSASWNYKSRRDS